MLKSKNCQGRLPVIRNLKLITHSLNDRQELMDNLRLQLSSYAEVSCALPHHPFTGSL